MKILPIIYSAHHASHDFGSMLSRCALSEQQRKRYCDLGTAQSVPQNGLQSLVATHSRGIVDLNRAPDHESLFPNSDFGRPQTHGIWKSGQEPTSVERSNFKKYIYDSYHREIDDVLQGRCAQGKASLVIAWDNTADYVIGNDQFGNSVQMPSIILSNNGDEGVTTGSHVSCDGDFLLDLGTHFSQELKLRGLPCDVHYNNVFHGGYITQHYTNFTKKNGSYSGARVQSLQVEYNMAMTHDQVTLREDVQAMEKLRNAFELAIEKTIRISRG